MAAAANPTPAFDRLHPLERASVLDVLLRRHPELRAEAEIAALAQLQRVSADETARRVVTCLTDLELQDLAGRAGRVPGGYVHETDAAYQLVEEALEPIQADLRRLIDLDLRVEAEQILLGLLDGLHRCIGVRDGTVLGYAGEDTPEELAAWAVEEARRAGIEPDPDELDRRCPTWQLTPTGLRR